MQSARFTLTTVILPSGTLAPNTYGALLTQTTKQSMMWTNIDLVTIMGNEMWEKYDYFNLTLSTGTMGIVGNLPTANASRMLTVNMKGLQFVNCNYSISQRCNSNTTQIGYFKMSGANSIACIDNNSSLDTRMFQKGSRYVDLYITLNTVLDGSLPDPTGLNTGNFPHQIYNLRIDPVIM